MTKMKMKISEIDQPLSISLILYFTYSTGMAANRTKKSHQKNDWDNRVNIYRIEIEKTIPLIRKEEKYTAGINSTASDR